MCNCEPRGRLLLRGEVHHSTGDPEIDPLPQRAFYSFKAPKGYRIVSGVAGVIEDQPRDILSVQATSYGISEGSRVIDIFTVDYLVTVAPGGGVQYSVILEPVNDSVIDTPLP